MSLCLITNVLRSHLLTSVVALATIVLIPQVHAADLQEIFEQAKGYDADIKAAQFDHEAAIQRLPLARSAFRPQLNAGYALALNGVTEDGSDTFESRQLSLRLSQTLFNRANSALISQSKLGVLQADAQLMAQQQGLILRVTQKYFDVLRAQANVEFSQSELEAIGRQREQAEQRFDVGLVPVTDVRDAQAQYDLAVAQEIAASNQLETTREALLVTSGANADSLATLAEDMPLAAPNPPHVDAWVETAKDQNLDLIVAKLASETAQAGVKAERGARYPTLDLVGTGAAGRTHQEGRPNVNSGALSLELQLPILTGGRVTAQVAQAQAEARSAAERLVAQERSTVQQTRDAFRGVVASISRATALRQALSSTQKSAEATEAGFRVGTRTSVDVLRALRDTYRARSDYAGARYDYIINSLNLRAAAGSLSEADLLPINNFLVEPAK